ncbi:hypothetical protein D9M71_215620 [compost metagenome]
MLVAEADHQPLRRGTQKHFQRRQVLNHGQAQVVAGKFDFGALGTEGQVGAPQQAVVTQRQARMAEVRTVNGNAPPAQPAQQTDHQHQEGFFTKPAGIVVRRTGVEADDRTLATHGQRAAKVAQEQAEVGQALTHGLVQIGLLNQGTANQGETARRHAMGIEPEKLIVELADLDQPQRRKRIGRHPRRGLVHDRRINARLFEHGRHALRIIAQPMDHCLHEIGGNRVLFPHWFASLSSPEWQKTSVPLNSFGIGQPPCRL